MPWSPVWPVTGLVLAALTCGFLVLPGSLNALDFVAHSDDPVAAVDFGLAEVATAERLNREIETARKEADHEMVESLAALATNRHIEVRAIVPSDNDPPPSQSDQGLQDFIRGFSDGTSTSTAGYAGSLASDVSGYGDLRDLVGEGRKLARGEKADELLIGLASAGLVVSGATWLSLGAALPARGGLTLTKAMVRAGRLSKPLAASLSRLVVLSVDRKAAADSLAALARFDLSAARRTALATLKPGAMHEIEALGANTGRLYQRLGARGTQQVFSLAESTDEVARAANLAQAKGPMTLAVLRLLGRSALLAGAFSLTLLGWLATAGLYLVGLACLARRFGLWIGRRLWRGRRGWLPKPHALMASVQIRQAA